jgi:poly(3-hydroxybutyrate) depolymerase
MTGLSGEPPQGRNPVGKQGHSDNIVDIMRRMRPTTPSAGALVLVAALSAAGAGPRQDLPRGRLIDDVRCAADPSQGYALYLPSTYTPDRAWSLLIAFHPGANGRAMTDKYRVAAEQYGYIVAGSNNSRNGPATVSTASVAAMSADLGRRFSIDSRRLYLTGMSGGSRLALQVALTNPSVAGVIASSAGFLDNQPRASVPFAIFGTAGTEDINHLEMRMLDRTLRSPHRLVIFEGGHTLPPDSVALEAIEWMELQAMKSGRRIRDEAFIDHQFDARRGAATSAADPAAVVHLLDALAEDFRGLRDVTGIAAQSAALARRPEVKKALASERADDDAERQILSEVLTLEAALGDADRRAQSLLRLRERFTRLSHTAAADADSPERRQARRVLRQLTMGAAERTTDPEYLELLRQFRPR